MKEFKLSVLPRKTVRIAGEGSYCDFCLREEVEGIASDVLFLKNQEINFKKTIDERPKYSTIFMNYRIDSWEHGNTIEDTAKVRAIICFDCIKQIYKQLK